MNNISDIKECYGCGVCATICTKNIIKISLNKDGFYEPSIIETDKCTNCGLCRDVCSYLQDNVSLTSPTITAYAAWSKNHSVRRKCSSGGVGFEIGRTLIEDGYKACGVRYNIDLHRAEHYIAETVNEFIPSIGSKYIQSYTYDGLKSIDRRQKYLVTGTPCQIDSFRRYLQKFKKEDNFVLLDFFCHGVPSMLMWKKYIESAEKRIGKLTYVTWRNKHEYGWHDSWLMGMDNTQDTNSSSPLEERRTTIESRWSQGDIFYQMFLENVCLNKACYKNCKYKYNKSSADIRIGDAWGEIYKKDQDGVSAAIAFTPKGNEILKRLNCELKEHSFEEVAEGQIKNNVIISPYYDMVMYKLKNKETTIEEIFNYIRKEERRERIIRIISNPLQTIKKILRRIK